MEDLRNMTSIGFEAEIKPEVDHGDDMLFIRLIDTMTYRDECINEFSAERAMDVAVQMMFVRMGNDGCKQCADQCVESLDFSLLASPAASPR